LAALLLTAHLFDVHPKPLGELFDPSPACEIYPIDRMDEVLFGACHLCGHI
jgi:hypothetical protein